MIRVDVYNIILGQGMILEQRSLNSKALMVFMSGLQVVSTIGKSEIDEQ